MLTSLRCAWALALVCAVCVAPLVGAARDYYEVLGVRRTASDREIKTSYRKIARAIHPDKHPDKATEFMELSEAYQVLSDPELRAVYDQHGAEAAQQRQAQNNNGQRPGDPMDLFRQFFGGGAGASDETPKGPRQTYNAELALSDIYVGRVFTLEHIRPVVCPACYGSGAHSPQDIHTCSACQGQGVQLMRQQLMPGFATNVQVACPTCGGKGKIIKKACRRCRGDKTVMERTEIDVDVEAGAREGAEYVFEGLGQQAPDIDPGDVVVSISSKTEPGDYRRVGHNLYYTLPISLPEALFGFTKEMRHYDGHTFTVRRTQPTQPHTVDRIPDEGLPIPEGERDDAQGRIAGDLFVTYEVIVPQLTGKRRDAVMRAFGVEHEAAHADL